jgi:hypothetical protein
MATVDLEVGSLTDLVKQFHEFLVEQGKIPFVCMNKLPPLMPEQDGSWRWNRNVDDPTITRTCNPINSFEWKWKNGGSTLTCINHISTQMGNSTTTKTWHLRS